MSNGTFDAEQDRDDEPQTVLVSPPAVPAAARYGDFLHALATGDAFLRTVGEDLGEVSAERALHPRHE